MFPCLPAGNISCGHKICVRDPKMFLISFRNILRPQQMFPRLLAQEKIMSNNVSATMCPRLPSPFISVQNDVTSVYISFKARYQFHLMCFSFDWKKTKSYRVKIVIYIYIFFALLTFQKKIQNN